MHLHELPKTVLYQIIAQLPLRDLGSLIQTCKFFNNFADEELYQYLWMDYLYQSPYFVNNGLGLYVHYTWGWKRIYREQYYLQYLSCCNLFCENILVHRYLDVETDGSWTFVYDQKEYGAVGDISGPLAIGFYNVVESKSYDSDDTISDDEFNDVENEERKLAGCFNHTSYKALKHSSDLPLVSVLSDMKDKKSEECLEDMIQEKLRISDQDKVVHDQELGNTIHENLKWLENGSKHFMPSFISRIPMNSLDPDTSPLHDYWKDISPMEAKNLIEWILIGKVPNATPLNGKDLFDPLFSAKVASASLNIFEIDQKAHQCYTCINVEQNDYEKRLHASICILGELRCVIIAMSWNLSEEKEMYNHCKEINKIISKVMKRGE